MVFVDILFSSVRKKIEGKSKDGEKVGIRR